MKRTTTILASLLFVSSGPTKSLAQYLQWGNLKAGPYSVGYQVINQQDNSRFVKPEFDFEGNASQLPRTLPVQINIWYPASKGGKQMFYEEYVFISRQREAIRMLSENEKQEALDNIKATVKYAIQVDLSEEELVRIAKTPVAAVLNAKHLNGPFPVIIAGSDRGGANTNNVLFEYLASLGYVVVCVPSNSHLGAIQSVNPQSALAERLGTLEFLMGFLSTITYVDVSAMGVLGVNFDGMSALLFQMKNMQADAVVSLDGWEGKSGSVQSVIESTFFDAVKMRVPFFAVYQDENNPPPYLKLSNKLYDTLKYSERFKYVLDGMNHIYLVSHVNFMSGLPSEKKTAYQFLYSIIGNFFDAYVKKSADALTLLRKLTVSQEISSVLAKVAMHKSALPAVPSNAELEVMYTKGEYDKIVRVLKEGKKLNPGLDHWGPILHLYGFRLIRAEKFPEAIVLLVLNNELYPGNPFWHDRLAQAYEASGDKENAEKVFQHVLDLLTEKDTLTDEEASLKETTKKRLRN